MQITTVFVSQKEFTDIKEYMLDRKYKLIFAVLLSIPCKGRYFSKNDIPNVRVIRFFLTWKKPTLELRRSPKQINCFLNVGGSFNCKYILSDTRLAMPVYSGNEVAKVKFNLARKN